MEEEGGGRTRRERGEKGSEKNIFKQRKQKEMLVKEDWSHVRRAGDRYFQIYISITDRDFALCEKPEF